MNNTGKVPTLMDFTLLRGRHNKQINGQVANSDKRSKENKQSDVQKSGKGTTLDGIVTDGQAEVT